MRALTWHGVGDIRCETVPDPKIENPGDVVVKVTACAICGSDLHLMGGFIPFMKPGDVLGHECMGEVVEVGKDVQRLKTGDRVVVPFTICCGRCSQCQRGNWSACRNTNPNGAMQAQLFGHPLAGLFGYSHLTGGFAGGQAEYIRVPFADNGPIRVPDGLTDEQVLFLSDIFPTAWMAAEHCEITPSDTVLVMGCGPVGLLAIRSCFLLGAKRVIAVDGVPERLALAKESGAEVLDYHSGEVHEGVLAMTAGEGPDAVIEAVGMESHGHETPVQRVASAVMEKTLPLERPFALNAAILACRPGGILSVPGVYGGFVDRVAMGALMNKGLTLKTGQTHMQRYMRPLLERIERGEIDPSYIITHRAAGLEDGPDLYYTFREKRDGCVKVVLKPHG